MRRIFSWALPSLYSSPAQVVERTVSPALTWSGRRVPSLSILPLPTASTLPRCGLFLALSGSKMPPDVFSCDGDRRTTMRSPSGLTFMARPHAPNAMETKSRARISKLRASAVCKCKLLATNEYRPDADYLAERPPANFAAARPLDCRIGSQGRVRPRLGNCRCNQFTNALQRLHVALER